MTTKHENATASLSQVRFYTKRTHFVGNNSHRWTYPELIEKYLSQLIEIEHQEHYNEQRCRHQSWNILPCDPPTRQREPPR